MTVQVNIIVTCTKRKSVAVPDRLKFRTVRKGPGKARFGQWRDRLKSTNVETVAVRDLYSGDHWKVARSMEQVNGDHNSSRRLWVASAGYGLVSLDDRIKPYSATFSASHPDSVTGKAGGVERSLLLREWWRLMSKWRSHRQGGTRSIAEVAAANPRSPLIIIASENYLAAIANDVRDAIEQLATPDLCSIVSAGCKSLDGLTQHLVPCDARLQHAVGGALRSLNVRVARLIITECRRSQPTLPVIRRKLGLLLQQQPELVRVERTAQSDAAVRRFILRELRKSTDIRRTSLLRKLRDDGKACEYSRFAALFSDVREQFDGS